MLDDILVEHFESLESTQEYLLSVVRGFENPSMSVIASDAQHRVAINSADSTNSAESPIAVIASDAQHRVAINSVTEGDTLESQTDSISGLPRSLALARNDDVGRIPQVDCHDPLRGSRNDDSRMNHASCAESPTSRHCEEQSDEAISRNDDSTFNNTGIHCIYTRHQTKGIGSRGDAWQHTKNGFYFSFYIAKSALPSDIPPQSFSIFFGYAFKEYLNSFGFETWLKWPNDIYYMKGKVGGVLCSHTKAGVVCGIGLNFYSPDSKEFATLPKNADLDIEKVESATKFLKNFFKFMKNFTSWNGTLRKYRLEFYKFFSAFYGDEISLRLHIDGEKTTFKLSEIRLCGDGAILASGHKVYSLR